MAQFFIGRPIFAWVLAIVVMLAGLLSLTNLPVAQYPEVAPPAVTIQARYPGASAQTVQDTVVQIIEQNLTGIDGVQYISSTSDGSGTGQITLTFIAGTDPDTAQVQVQNKLQGAMPLLPQEVQQQGIRVTKSTAGFLMVMAFVSEDGGMDRYDIADYVAANVQDQLSRVDGVGSIQLFGSQYAMRVWLDADRLATFALTTNDVTNAIRAQNAQIAAGELGGTPALPGQQVSASIIVQTRLETPEEFRQILLRVNPDGSQVRLGDVARVELGGENYQFESQYNDQTATGLAVSLASGANALNTSASVRQRIDELSQFFPQGLKVEYAFDTTPFVRLSIMSVVYTLIEAVVLVFLVMYLFLQNFRATLIPTIAIPVVLLGTLGVLSVLGFSVNTLTMFAMVLAIGLLVDDAIVVVENVERVMEEDGLPPKEATRKSMKQITGALIGIGLVLSAVFVPMAFFGGSAGVIYRQFSVTIVSAMTLSVLVALILTPALCATMLKPIAPGHHAKTGFFGWFNRNFNRASKRYQSSVGYMLGRAGRFMLLYLALVGVLAFSFTRLPTSFLPEEDQGLMFIQVSMPTGATKERTEQVMDKVEQYLLEQEADYVASVFSVVGFSFSGRGQNSGIAFVRLQDWSERSDSVQQVAGRAMGAFSQIKEGMVFAFVPPAISQLGTSSGFDLQLQDLGGNGHEAFTAARNQLLGMAAQDSRVANVRPNGQEDTPQFKLDVDQEKAAALGVSLAEVSATFTTAWASSYVNDFIDQGRVKRVFVQGEAKNRMLPEDVGDWYVRNNQGEMVPFSAFTSGRWVYGSPRLERFNGVPSMNIQGQAAPGLSSGVAMQAMEEMASKLPPGFGFSWSGMSLQEQETGDQGAFLYALSILVVFLCLAALYESWTVPFAVILVVPLGVLGAVAFALLRGLNNDIYFQVALLTTIGLSAKNAILIVEFAKDLYRGGMDLVDATLEAVRMRLRPIIMTSLAFGLGVVPLAIATGAGSGSQNAVGTAVLGGVVAGTFLAIFFVPLFFIVVFRAASRLWGNKPAAKLDEETGP